MVKQELNISEIKEFYQLDWGISDFLVSDEQNLTKITEGPKRIDGFIIGICLKGRINFEHNHSIYHGTNNSMLISTPMQYFQLLETSADCRLRFIIFSKRFLVASNIQQQILDKFSFIHPNALPFIQLTETQAKDIVQQFTMIWKRFLEVAHPFRKEVISNLLLILLHDFEAVYREHFQLLQSKSGRSKELTKLFLELLPQHFKKEHHLDFYAKQLCVSTKYLSESVKDATGKTAGEHLSEALSLEAQALLQQPQISIKEVTRLLGFPDASTFGKFFKRYMGTTPSAYQKSSIQ